MTKLQWVTRGYKVRRINPLEYELLSMPMDSESKRCEFFSPQVYPSQTVIPNHRLWMCKRFTGEWKLVLRQSNQQYLTAQANTAGINTNTPEADVYSILHELENQRSELEE